MSNNREKGIFGETIASEYLKKKGYRIIERNYRSKVGEIDIIAEINDILAFVEVKTRSNTNFGYPYEAVNRKKLDKIIKTSLVYIKQKGCRGYQIRYDIIEIILSKDTKINHIENVFCI